jgi:hypothetical protein
MAHTKEYIEAMFKAAKGYLPSWVWDHLHKIAFPSSGGVARHRKEDILKQVAPISPAGLSAEEIGAQLQIRGEQYSKTESQYIQPTDDARTACGACRFFLRPPQGEIGACQIVIGPIAWFGTCQFYVGAQEEATFALAHVVQKQEGFEIQTILFPKARWAGRQGGPPTRGQAEEKATRDDLRKGGGRHDRAGGRDRDRRADEVVRP